ncbi:GNAT family N-acetyltransferase [Evansella cellulosilytica]|uniref:GCN5-related N-acetyltransferase n=1 Tax=Evansella cellulosilytica (strain ATCC 21833 / DSM 2522 / FERM P-1141 / JCM 9156 / N-4) TaxID=649639 RepID=E6TVD7_EVAC2|nr:GNAT family N-acetyltransferase [Evansella cellulosilytica]ADU30954.1 GCN5-related N-acetyltransferase [Evansella cellulosilytica DSM 2522]
MLKTIRELSNDDFHHFEKMETGLEDDYILRIFERLTIGNNRLYGLFIDNQLISMGGYTIFAGRYAMLGRLRSDRRFRGNNYGTALISYVMNAAFQLDGIEWVGANTQEDNLPARRVVDKLGLTSSTMLHGATTNDTSFLERGEKIWHEVHSLEKKKQWLKSLYIDTESIFPYEIYYSFPASDALFTDTDVEAWTFYENEAATRVVILKPDQKGNHYLHVVYPWSDLTTQSGLWETIANDYRELKKQTDDDTYIWIDLKKEEIKALPTNHTFELPSPWVLYGIERNEWSKRN